MRPLQTRHALPRGAACIAAAAALLATLPLPAITARMSLDEVRPGMTGTGITVFEGTTRDRFDVHVLGILTNAVGPRRHLIVARIEGGPLADTGVIQGMSGSPVYVEDRLIGALSYAFGAFSTEAIAGITPIGEMAATDAAAAPARTAARLPPAGTPSAPDMMLAHLGGALLERAQPFARQPIDVRAEGLPAAEAGRLGTLLRPIGTPLGLSGFVPDVRALWSDTFGGSGVVSTVTAPAGGAPQGATPPPGAPLQPGDAIGAALMRGDFTMAGTGTVTLVDEGRVYAFGHPFYNLGPAQFPMTRARVTTLLPSRAQSTRLASVGEVLGTIDQDRATGIYGTLGPGPRLVPVTIALAADDRGLRQRFAFEVVDDRVLTPLLTYTGVLNTFFAWTRQLGRRHVPDRRHRAPARPARRDVRQHLRRRRGRGRGGRRRRRSADDACRQPTGAGRVRPHRHRRHVLRAAAHRDRRARLDRRGPAAGGGHRLAASGAPRLGGADVHRDPAAHAAAPTSPDPSSCSSPTRPGPGSGIWRRATTRAARARSRS